MTKTKTTAITARVVEYFDPYDIKGAGRLLGEQLIQSLAERMEDGIDNNGQAQ